MSKQTFKEYLKTRESVMFVVMGIIGVLAVAFAPEKVFTEMGIKTIWIVLFCIILYIGNLTKNKEDL